MSYLCGAGQYIAQRGNGRKSGSVKRSSSPTMVRTLHFPRVVAASCLQGTARKDTFLVREQHPPGCPHWLPVGPEVHDPLAYRHSATSHLATICSSLTECWPSRTNAGPEPATAEIGAKRRPPRREEKIGKTSVSLDLEQSLDSRRQLPYPLEGALGCNFFTLPPPSQSIPHKLQTLDVGRGKESYIEEIPQTQGVPMLQYLQHCMYT